MTLFGCSSKGDSDANMSLETFQKGGGNDTYYEAVSNTIKTNPSEALNLIEKGEATGMLNWHQAAMLEFYAYRAQGNDSQAILTLTDFISDPAFNNLPEAMQLEVLLEKVKTDITIARYDNALDESLSLVKRARKLGDNVLLASIDVQVSNIYANQNLPLDSREYSNLAYNRLKDGNSEKELFALSSVLNSSLDNCINTSTYDRADWLLEQWKFNINRLRNKKEIKQELVDEEEVAYLAKAAYIYKLEGKNSEAAEAYSKYTTFDFSKVTAQDEVIPYLILVGDNDKALELMPSLLSYGKDTIRMGYYYNLSDRSEIAFKKGETEKGLDLHFRADVIKDSINVRNISAATIEAESQYGYDKQEEQLFKHQRTIRSQRIMLFSLVAVFLLILGLIPMAIFTYRTLKKKNDDFAAQIDEQIQYGDILGRTRAELAEANNKIDLLERMLQNSIPSTPQAATSVDEMVKTEAIKEELASIKNTEDEEMARQFAAMDKIIEDKKLYLDPDFNRQQLEAETKIPKEVASRVIKANTGDNFAVYINEKRLRHSVVLLRDYNNYTIEAVALDSGFGEVRSFYRVFREKYGVTPTKYRESIIRKNQS